jgi:CubicO group peptidase (beta-lactamase class C family)
MNISRPHLSVAVAVMLTLFFVLPLHLAAAVPSDISRVLQPYVDRHELAGAVTLVASKDKILSLEAVGYTDIGVRKPMRTDTLFWIASMSKPITATVMMMLVDEGKVRLAHREHLGSD